MANQNTSVFSQLQYASQETASINSEALSLSPLIASTTPYGGTLENTLSAWPHFSVLSTHTVFKHFHF